MNKRIFIIALFAIGIALLSYGVKLSTSELYAQSTPCEEDKYEFVCCGPQCELNGETRNYCLNSGGSYVCCYDNCDTDPGEG